MVAITLGCTGAMSFSPHSVDAKHTQPKLGKRVLNDHGLAVEVRKTAAGFVVDLILPPRSVYVMSGPTRTEWKHAVKTNVAAVRDAHRHLNSPCFRDCSIRRTITLRSCKSTSDEVLNRLARAKPHDQRIQKRVSDQNKWRPQRNGDKLNNHELQLERLAASRIVNTIHTTFRPLFLSDTERGYKVKNPKMTCWPLLDVANALQPSKLVPAEMMTMACGTLGGSVGGRSANASASSSVAVGSGGAQGEWECSLCTLKNRRSDAQCVACGNRRPESERPPDAVRREALIPGGFGFSAPSEEDQLQWALRVSADQARNGPAANEEKMLQRALKASVEEAAKKHSPKVKVEAVKASVEETTTKAPPDTKTEDSPPKLTKEDLRRLRLAALERKTAPPPCDPEGQDNAKRQKRDSTDSQEVIELTNSDDEDVGTQKPSAKKVAEVIELD